MSQTNCVIVMGVSGCGKTSVGQGVAEQNGWKFFDADGFHPTANVEKMRAGQPLTDTDRWPWLDRLNALLRHQASKNESSVLACSALKEVYRQRLTDRLDRLYGKVLLVHLTGSFELINSRMEQRTNHYMPASLLQSQFATLESPANALVVPVEWALNDQISRVRHELKTVD